MDNGVNGRLHSALQYQSAATSETVKHFWFESHLCKQRYSKYLYNKPGVNSADC